MKKVLIWGTGNIAQKMMQNGVNAEIIGFIESYKKRDMYNGKRVYSVNELPSRYDMIIVANSFANEIYNICQTNNIPLQRVLFMKNIKKREGIIDLDIIKEILGEKNLIDYCEEFDLKEYSFIQDDVKKYEKLNDRDTFRIQEKYIYPILHDKYAKSADIGNYFLQDLWAAKRVVEAGTRKHFDIGSRVDGFIAHLLTVNIDVTMIDIREFPYEIEHLNNILDDATTLHQIPDNSIESISALCSLEHFGLGRYGDPIDPEGCFKCFSNIQKKMKKGGRLYLSVPVGMERVEFNAHRVFYASTIIENFSSLQLREFSCAAENKIEYDVDIHKYDNDQHHGEYRYGLFFFVK